jgi:hypothetical protein
MNDDLKGSDRDLTQVLSRYWPEGTEENNERSQNEQPIPQPKFDRAPIGDELRPSLLRKPIQFKVQSYSQRISTVYCVQRRSH